MVMVVGVLPVVGMVVAAVKMTAATDNSNLRRGRFRMFSSHHTGWPIWPLYSK
jgi:hypothetical protein